MKWRGKMEKVDKMVTLEEIERVWGNADFGGKPDDKIAIVKLALLKRASFYYNGFTATGILKKLGLVSKKDIITRRGRFCLFWLFQNEIKTGCNT